MRLHVDKEADALYLRLDDSKIIESEEVAPGVILEVLESLHRWRKKTRSDDGLACYREFVTRNALSSRMETSRSPRRPPLHFGGDCHQ